MEVQLSRRNARMSPKKVREVARTIQGRMANDAVEYLTLIPRKSARLIAKTLKSAIANAENNENLAADSLTVKSAVVENGPVLKRFKAGAKGFAMPRRKKMSHIRIILSNGEPQPSLIHGSKNQSYRFPPRRKPRLAVPLVREQEGIPEAPPRGPTDPLHADGEAQAGLRAANLHRARIEPRPRQDLHCPPRHRHRPKGQEVENIKAQLMKLTGKEILSTFRK